MLADTAGEAAPAAPARQFTANPKTQQKKGKEAKEHHQERQQQQQEKQLEKQQQSQKDKQPASHKGSSSETTPHSASHPAPHSVTHKKLSLFDHLPKKYPVTNPHSVEGDASLHPATIKLGLLYRSGAVREDDDRVAALLTTFCNVISDYKTPTNNSLSRDLDKHIRLQMAHLVECRQHCMGMGNLHKMLRHAISRVPVDMSESEAKALLVDKLHCFFEDRIYYARGSIGNLVATIVQDEDIILTFGSSPLLRKVLLKMATVRKVRLIVVDARPLHDGLLTLRALSPRIACVYTPLSGLTTVMKEATRVILAATALLTNGSMLGPAGSAMVAAVAKASRVPVIVLCESYKFSEKVQLGSIVFNEMGAASEIAVLDENPGPASATHQQQKDAKAPIPCYVPQTVPGYRGALESAPSAAAPSLYQVLNMRYDCTPIGNISVVATETGLIPPTSIPVLLRELRMDSEGDS